MQVVKWTLTHLGGLEASAFSIRGQDITEPTTPLTRFLTLNHLLLVALNPLLQVVKPILTQSRKAKLLPV